MKNLSHISVVALFVLSSCSSGLYTGADTDDLYYLPSDQPVVRVKTSNNEQMAEGNLTNSDYYNNIYAADTLVSDEFYSALNPGEQIVINNNYGGGYGYYDNLSYSGRLMNFHGNYFSPYWSDPYYSYGYPSYGFGIGIGFGFGYPYYDPFYSYGGYYGGFYGGYYMGYGRYYGGYYPYYPPYYGGYYPGYCCYNDV
jgi:hypothetical protein